MVLRFALIVVLSLGAVDSFAQDQCCACIDPNTHVPFQVRQSTMCDIACSASGGASQGVQACFPIPQGPSAFLVPYCDRFSHEIGGDCKGNHWDQCELSIKLLSAKVVAGVPATFEFFNDNLGQEYGAPPLGRWRLGPLSGSIDWDDSPNEPLSTGRYRVNHTFHSTGQHVIKATISGEFKWNNPSEGASCSYSARTAPASLTVVVEAPPATKPKKKKANE
jgi:hypothetical protein